MPINIINKYDCTGCGACWNACPKSCIKSVKDEEGFPYPKVDTAKCIDCGLCLKVCPMQNKIRQSSDNPQIYAAWSKDKTNRYNSTSGGAFSEFAKSVLAMGGVVVGAAYDQHNLVYHVIASNSEELDLLRQSKYIQSDINDIYIQIKTQLKEGKIVLFCGSPCQVAGLKSFLQKEYTGLVMIDFICRGMNSPKAYTYWLKELEERYKSRVVKVWFKYKEYGWKKSPLCTRLDFENGQYYVANGEDNSFMKGYLRGNLYLRPSCAECRFKGSERYSDITLADFWKVEAKYDDDKGTSMVMLNSSVGRDLFDRTKERLVFFPKSMAEIREGNVCFDRSVALNPRSRKFLSQLGEKPFSKLVEKYTKTPLYRRVLRKIKRIVKKIAG